jgi:hypothetical protein
MSARKLRCCNARENGALTRAAVLWVERALHGGMLEPGLDL